MSLLGKDNVVPVHATNACGGAEVHFHSLLTFELDVSRQLHALAALPPTKGPLVPIQ